MNLIKALDQLVTGSYTTLRIKCDSLKDAELLCLAFRKSISVNNGYAIITIVGRTVAEQWSVELHYKVWAFKNLLDELKHHDKTIQLISGMEPIDGKFVDFDFGSKK